jgi:ubiquitin carboxyl-terminal hydrolase 8
MLDVRSRDEYDAGRIRGETVCLEPVVLRDG